MTSVNPYPHRPPTLYTWHVFYEDPLMAGEVFSDVERVIRIWEARWPKRYQQGTVSGAMFGLIEVTMLCSAAEQWTAHRFATRLARALAIRCRVRVATMMDPDPDRLPHPRQGLRDCRTGLLCTDLDRMVPWPAP